MSTQDEQEAARKAAKEQEAISYQFSGYNLPMLQLDATGPAYYVVGIHPYYINQPVYWQKPIYYGIIQYGINLSGYTPTSYTAPSGSGERCSTPPAKNNKGGLFGLIPINTKRK